MNEQWSEWFSLGGQIKGEASAAYAYVGNTRYVDVWVRGAGDGLWQVYWDGHNWNWVDHSQDNFKLGSSPTIVYWKSDSRGIFATDQQGFLHENYWDGKRLLGWKILDKNFKAQIRGNVSALILAPGQVELYMRSMDDKLWQANWDGAQWHWEPHAGNYTLVTSPVAIFQPPQYWSVFRTEADGRVFQKYAQGRGNWTEWYPVKDTVAGEQVGGRSKGHVGVTIQDGNIVDLYMRRRSGDPPTDDRLYQKYWDPRVNRWTSWRRVPGLIDFKLGSSPTVISSGTRFTQDLQVHIFARGKDDGQLWHKYFD